MNIRKSWPDYKKTVGIEFDTCRPEQNPDCDKVPLVSKFIKTNQEGVHLRTETLLHPWKITFRSQRLVSSGIEFVYNIDVITSIQIPLTI